MAAAGQIDLIDPPPRSCPSSRRATSTRRPRAPAGMTDRWTRPRPCHAGRGRPVEQPRPTWCRAPDRHPRGRPGCERHAPAPPTLAADDGEPRVRTGRARLLDHDLDSLHARSSSGPSTPWWPPWPPSGWPSASTAARRAPSLPCSKRPTSPLCSQVARRIARPLRGRAPRGPRAGDPGGALHRAAVQPRRCPGPARCARARRRVGSRRAGPHHAVVVTPLDALDDITSARIRTTKGEVIVQLLPEEAPITVHNFVRLAEERWFDNSVSTGSCRTLSYRAVTHAGMGPAVPATRSPMSPLPHLHRGDGRHGPVRARHRGASGS